LRKKELVFLSEKRRTRRGKSEIIIQCECVKYHTIKRFFFITTDREFASWILLSLSLSSSVASSIRRRIRRCIREK